MTYPQNLAFHQDQEMCMLCVCVHARTCVSVWIWLSSQCSGNFIFTSHTTAENLTLGPFLQPHTDSDDEIVISANFIQDNIPKSC